MSIEYTDSEILAFNNEEKILPQNYWDILFNFKHVNKHIENRYNSFDEAILCLLKDCCFKKPRRITKLKTWL